jgi:hypothetical protein
MASRIEADLDRLETEPNRIDRHTQNPSRRNIAREMPPETDVAVPLDLIAPENLLTMMTVVRQPPELQLKFATSVHTATVESTESADLSGLGQMATPDLGYHLASFLVRREGEIAKSNDPYVKGGFAELELSARMLEHLMIKRTSGMSN